MIDNIKVEGHDYISHFFKLHHAICSRSRCPTTILRKVHVSLQKFLPNLRFAPQKIDKHRLMILEEPTTRKDFNKIKQTKTNFFEKYRVWMNFAHIFDAGDRWLQTLIFTWFLYPLSLTSKPYDPSRLDTFCNHRAVLSQPHLFAKS
jgi:hypothetical protein